MKVQILSKTIGQGAALAARGHSVTLAPLAEWAKANGYVESFYVAGLEGVISTSVITSLNGNGVYATLNTEGNLIHSMP